MTKLILNMALVMILFASNAIGQTFSSSPAASIPDDRTLNCYDITVSGVGTLNSSNGLETVCIDITHTWDNDLDISLVAPDGTTINLSSDNGGSSNNYTSTCFNMSGGTNITSGSAPFTGTYVPEGDLADINNGQNGDGTWQLCITDDSGGDSGTLNSWDMEFGPNPAAPPPPPAPTDQDCDGAIPVCQTTYSQSNSYSGTGNVTNEINSGPSCLNSGEKNDVWYIFTVQNSGDLNFSITPNSSSNDYDWAVFDITSANCSDIYSNSALEVSCNWSANVGNGGITGPNNGSTAQDEPAFAVTAGETYVINISNYSSSQSGYSLDFGSSTANIFDSTAPEIQSVTTPIACGATTIEFTFSENILCSTVDDADFSLTGPGGTYTLSSVTGSNCSAGGSFENTFTASVSPAITNSGTYTIALNASVAGSVTDNCGNTAPSGSLDFSISGVTASISYSTNITCNGLANGSAQASGSNGTSPYSYLWDDGSAQTTQTASSLNPGTYTVTVTDALGCSGVNTVTITEPDAIVLSSSGNDESCPSASDGDVTVSISNGGTSPFSYAWDSSPAQSTATASGLSGGTYNVTVTDANGCTSSTSETISAGGTITSDPAATADQCLTGNSFTFSNNGTNTGVTYAWDFGDASGTSTIAAPSYTYASSGTFTVSLTIDNGSCTDTETITVNVYDEPSATNTPTYLTCNGVCAGSIDLTVTGGNTPYTFVWDNGAGSSEDPSALCAGTYNVSITDVYGCTTSSSATITEPAVVTTTTSVNDATCNGASDGDASVVASGGTSPYTYLWDDGSAQTTATAVSLAAGTYNVVVTDANGCTANDSETVSEASAISISSTDTDINCNGASTGAIDVTVSGGTSPYTYSWTNSANSEDISSVSAGSYTLTVTDNNSCTETYSTTLTETTALSLTLTGTDLTCNADNSGSISSSVSGGTTAYSYLWDDGNVQTTATASSLAAGTFSLTVTDANGCTISASETITEPSALALSLTPSDASCNGICDASIVSSASGGTGALSYSWDNGAGSSANASSLCAGINYTLTVTDANSCTINASSAPSEPTALSLTTSGNDVSCNGLSDGDATVSVSGGTSAYSYSWDDGALQSTATASSLAAGTYTVTITDASGCIDTETYTVGTPTAITLSTSSNDATCGNTNGDATVSASGGAGGYTYLWDDGGAQTTATAGAIASGSYTVQVTDANGCIESAVVAVSDAGGPTVSISSSVNVLCNGGSTGSATSTVSGGATPYSYAWDDAGSQTGVTASGLSAGTYSLTVTDNVGCTNSTSVTITEATALNTSTSGNDLSCNADASGDVTVTVTGGAGGYTYLWDDGSAQTTATATSLSAGTYNVTVTDASGCTAVNSVSISEPNALAISSSNTNIDCNGASTGAIDITVSGGTAAYSYSWDNSQTSEDLTSLAAGTYILTVTDANGCTETSTEVLTEGTVIVPVLTPSDPLCNGSSDGSIASSVSGGSGSYTYAWDDGASQTTATASSLSAGTYNLIATDANGCTGTAASTLTNPAALSVTATSSDASCGQNNGSATASVSGGTSPYTYLWDDGGAQTTITASNIGSGSYNVTVTDASGCTGTVAVSVNSSSGGTASISSSSNASCNSVCDGSATAAMTGGTSPFTYAWDDGASQTTATASSLCAGSYNVTITDAGGCSSSASVTITEGTAIVISVVSQDNPNCFGASDGSIDVTVSGGTGSYTYDWNGSFVSEDLSLLSSGTYNFTATDSDGCQNTTSVTLTDPSAIATSLDSYTDVSCFGGSDGTINITTSGGTSPYTYAWNDPSSQTTEDASALSAGSFTVTATDANGCSTTLSQALTEASDLTLTTSSNAPTCGASNGDASVSVSGGTTAYTYAWDDPSTQTTATASALAAGTYNVVVTDANGCSANSPVTIVDSGSPTITTSGNNASCNGVCDAYATVNIVSGTTPYTFLWDDGSAQTTATASNLCAGTYNVTVTDGNGCSASESIVIAEPNVIALSLSSSGISCPSDCDATINSTITGGTGPFTYSWDDAANQTTANASSLCSGTYVLTITDANSCTDNESLTIIEPTFTATTTSTSATCGNSDGSTTVIVSAGTGPYTYLWNDANAQSTATATGLASGTYTVSITDANGCVITESVSVSDSGGPTVSVDSQNNPTCFGDTDGDITVSATGGTSPYTYLWDDASAQTTATAINLGDGTFIVTVSDNNGCTSSETVVLIEPAQVGLTLASSGNETCNGQGNGNALVTVTNGVAPTTYSWSDPAIGNTGLATNLSAGTYNVSVFDANGCTASTSVTITAPDALAVTISSNDANCNAACDGSLSSTVTGGTLPYTYSWDDSNSQTTASASNLCDGTYNLTVVDNNACSIITNGTVAEPSAIVITLDNQTNESCASACDGILSVSVSGGSSPYTYLWDNPSASNGTSINNLCQGSYTLTVTDNAGCTSSETYTITSGGALTLSTTGTDPSCNGDADGTASVSISGGTSPFTYLWDDASLQSTNTASGLIAGSYSVSVTDANGCSNTAAISLTNPTAISLTSSTVDANCGNNDGSATVVVSSGDSPFTYLWNDPSNQTTASASAISSGTYKVIVTDANACQDSLDVTVNDASGPVVAVQNYTDALCFGAASGTATLQINGGQTPYSILWDDASAQTGITASNLAAGTYSAAVTDNLGCTANTTVTIDEPTALVAAISNSGNTSCYGVCDGTATVLANSGTSPYSYTWTNGNTTASVSDLCAGNHQVIVSDANSCSVTLSVDITEPDEIIMTLSSSDAACNLASGQASVSISNGPSPFVYSWNDAGSQSTATAINLAEAWYTVTVTDANSCIASDSVFVSNVNDEVLTISNQQDESCFAYSDGQLAISAAGMESPLSYLWDDASASTSASISNLPGGIYTVQVTDSLGCQLSETITIASASQISTTLTQNDPSCFGLCDGFITSSISGGASPYTYQWDDSSNSTMSSVSGLCNGAYQVIVSDANGCKDTTVVSLNEPVAISVSSTISNANCGNPDGSITANASNGSAPYSYAWNDSFNQINATATGLPSGSYIVIATDANGCTGSDTAQVVDIAGATASIESYRNVSCYGVADGYIEAVADGGTGPFTYLWDDASVQITNVASNLDIGTYTIVITDANGCTSSAIADISQPDSLYTVLNATETSCQGSSDGTAFGITFGGVGPYIYNWNDPSSQTSVTATGLSSGSYSLVVTDANGCTALNSINVSSPTAVGGSVDAYNTLCFESCDGALKVNATGGNGTYTYSWNDPANQSLDSITGLCAQTYSVTITDGNGCIGVLSGTVGKPDVLSTSLGLKSDALCYGQCSGYLEVSVAGGTTPYTYLWNDAFGQQNQGANNLCAGTYSVDVTDANGCMTSFTESIDQAPELALATSATQVSCISECDGTATVVVSGGTSPYSYLWDDPALQQSSTASNLCAGISRIQVRDANNCLMTDSVEVFEPSAISLTSTTTPSNCGGSNGSATVTVTGGTLPYAYQWNDINNQITNQASNLTAANYIVEITDGNGCIYQESIAVSDIAAPNVVLASVTHNDCSGDFSGSIGITVSGGVPGYTILWNDPANQTGVLAIGLAGGNFTATVTDNAGCTAIFSQTVNEPLPVAVAIADFDYPSCNGLCDGSAEATVGGGTAPFTYAWDDPLSQTTFNASNLCAGTYNITATDANGCFNSTSIVIDEPAVLEFTYTIENVDCYGFNSGRIDVNISGGTPGYFYNWIPTGNNGSSATDLSPGIHSLNLTDANGCLLTQDFLITEPDLLTVSSTAFPTTCSLNNGSVNITTQGGTTPYVYMWNPNIANTPIANGLAPMDYQVIVEDGNGCQESRFISVYETPSPAIENLIATNTSCSGSTDGEITINIKDALEPYTVIWAPFGGTDTIAENLPSGIYSVTLTDANGCEVSSSGVIDSPDPVEVITNGTEIICYGETINISGVGIGGNGGYSYTWSDATMSTEAIQAVNPLITTNYTVFATDILGCISDTETITVGVNPALEVEITTIPELCFGDSIDLSSMASQGNGGPYYYNWEVINDTNQVINVKPSNTVWYFVGASDSCSIDARDSIEVVINPNPTVFINSDLEEGCQPLTVAFDLNTDLGTSYAWDLGNGETSTLETPEIIYPDTGVYHVSLTVTTDDGCTTSDIDSNLITVNPIPTAGFTPLPGITSTVAPTIHFADSSQGAITYVYTFGDDFSDENSSTLANTSHEYNLPGSYEVSQTVTNEFGCIDALTDTVFVLDGFILFFPDGFTPNGDGINDTWKPLGTGVENDGYELWVYNRWGELIFNSTDYNEFWDGCYQGRSTIISQEGVYVWKLVLVDGNSDSHFYYGNVSIVK